MRPAAGAGHDKGRWVGVERLLASPVTVAACKLCAALVCTSEVPHTSRRNHVQRRQEQMKILGVKP